MMSTAAHTDTVTEETVAALVVKKEFHMAID
jgi:hypothetical protein